MHRSDRVGGMQGGLRICSLMWCAEAGSAVTDERKRTNRILGPKHETCDSGHGDKQHREVGELAGGEARLLLCKSRGRLIELRKKEQQSLLSVGESDVLPSAETRLVDVASTVRVVLQRCGPEGPASLGGQYHVAREPQRIPGVAGSDCRARHVISAMECRGGQRKH